MPTWLKDDIPLISAVISLLAVFASLVIVFVQLRRARFDQSVNLLFRLEADFFSSPGKKMERAEAARGLSSGQPAEAEPILDFFETMALLLKRGALDVEMVWHTFFYWISHYYSAAETYIREKQTVDPLVWKDLNFLVERVRRMQRQRLGLTSLPPLSQADIAGFLDEEQAETTV